MWDNESIGQYIVNEQDRLERLRDRFEQEENRESEDEDNERSSSNC